MTAIELSHRQWMEQVSGLAAQNDYLRSEGVRSATTVLPQPTVELRHYDTGRLGYSISRHPASQFHRCRTSGGSPPLQHRDVLRSSGSMFFCTDSEGGGLPHAEAKLASFSKKYRELCVERAFPDKFEVRSTSIQQRVKTALKDIVEVEEAKRSGQRDEHGELIQVRWLPVSAHGNADTLRRALSSYRAGHSASQWK
jgi:hypothetical protein